MNSSDESELEGKSPHKGHCSNFGNFWLDSKPMQGISTEGV